MISDMDGRIINRVQVPLKKGMNEVMFNHGFGMTPGVYVCALMIDGLPVQSTKMIFRNR